MAQPVSSLMKIPTLETRKILGLKVHPGTTSVLLPQGSPLKNLPQVSELKFNMIVAFTLGRRPRAGDRLYLHGNDGQLGSHSFSRDLVFSKDPPNFSETTYEKYPLRAPIVTFVFQADGRWSINPDSILGGSGLKRILLYALALTSWPIHFEQRHSFLMAPRNVSPADGVLISPLHAPLSVTERENAKGEPISHGIFEQAIHYLFARDPLRGKELVVTVDKYSCIGGFEKRPFRVSKILPSSSNPLRRLPYVGIFHTGECWDVSSRFALEREVSLSDLLAAPPW
jgi:hypothetical protein